MLKLKGLESGFEEFFVFRWLIAFFCLGLSMPVNAAEQRDRRIPDEYESTGGLSLGLGNSGVAGLGGLSAVRLNPGMLALEKTYTVGGGYHWPTEGRDFFDAGVVDTQSSPIAAGFHYTGFSDDYDTELAQRPGSSKRDAAIQRRASLVLGRVMGKLSLGLGAQYVEGVTLGSEQGVLQEKRESGTTIGFGLAGLLTPRLRFGASVENMANKKVAEYAPQTIRAGVAYIFDKDVIAQLDVRQRERIGSFEQAFAGEVKTSEDEAYQAPERMGIASFSARIYDMLRVLGAYGQTITGPSRRSLSGGLAIVNKNASLSYTASRPHMDYEQSHQSVNGSFAIKF